MANNEYQFTGEMNDGTEFVHNIEARFTFGSITQIGITVNYLWLGIK